MICENACLRVLIDGQAAAVVPRTTTSEIHRRRAPPATSAPTRLPGRAVILMPPAGLLALPCCRLGGYVGAVTGGDAPGRPVGGGGFVASASVAEQRFRRGTFANGMEYLTWGSGPKTLLFIQGGPGSVVPKGGMLLRMVRRRQDPYAKAGYAVWMVTRRRHMSAGHTIADVADDYAQLIRQEFGGRVDVVVGVSYGGLIGQYLAAFHPGSFGHIALVGAGMAEVPGWVADVDSRWGAAIARGDAAGAGTVLAEYLLPGKPPRWARRLIGPLFGRLMFAGYDCPPGDILVESQAEKTFDSRAVLPRIQVPVLLICGDRDQAIPRDVAEETAKLIPGCTLIWHKGGHSGVGSSPRVADDILAFANRS